MADFNETVIDTTTKLSEFVQGSESLRAEMTEVSSEVGEAQQDIRARRAPRRWPSPRRVAPRRSRR